jgi:GH24 family phage-related lysozyme (muramidase)
MTPEQRKAAALALATALALPAEGMRRVWYYDPPGIPTVCMGHTGPDIDKTKVYSIHECKALMDKDMLKALNIVERCHPGLPAPVLAAFTDATFNIGPTVACNSTASRMLQAGDLKGACMQLLRWDKARVMGVMVALPGLTKRRILDNDLCMGGAI